jgi:branched-subunit amino acid aminotransferase/4-amino-4-deoxychorismate lyase
MLYDSFAGASFSISQKMWYGYGAVPLFSENIEMLKKQIDCLNLPFPVQIQDNRELFRLIKRMLNKNKLYRSGFIHLHIFWNNSEIHSLITCSTFTQFDFPLAEEGMLLEFACQKKFSLNTMNRYAFFSQPMWAAAIAEIHNSHYQQGIILNELSAICESAHANIFFIKGNGLITPSLKTGCYEDSLRKFIMESAQELGLTVVEKDFIALDDLSGMDEGFLASEELGLNWILGIQNIRYIRFYSEKIHDKLNEILKRKSVELLS